MRCPNCGAEIGNSDKCEYCGSSITPEMKKEQEILNKKGCPKCGSTNIKFSRENHGEVNGKSSKKIVHKTVGVCNDCGYTWYMDENEPKKRMGIGMGVYLPGAVNYFDASQKGYEAGS